jgi:hypothetical protein
MFSFMNVFGKKSKKNSMRKSKKSKTKRSSLRKTRRNKSSKKVKKGGMIPFI